MRFIMITIFAVTGRLVAPANANPIPNRNLKAGGMTIPLSRQSSFLNSESNKRIDLDAICSHGISVREKILSGLDNYERNTGTMHPSAVKRRESEFGTRGAGVPLKTSQNHLWVGEISIGTPPKTLKVQIDTGAADTWVLQTGCAGILGNRDLWDPNLSKSAERQWPFEIDYKDATIVEGDAYTDNVTIAGFTADPQTFGSVTSYTHGVRNNGDSDGLLGLAFPSVSHFGADPLFKSLVKQNRVINPTFSFKFSSAGAEMYVGGANSMLYNGDIAYTRVTYPALWQVSMDDVRVNGNKVFENVPVYFDTGSTYIYGDWKQVAELYKHVDATLQVYRGYGFYYLPCDSFPTLSFTFGGKSFDIPPRFLNIGPIAEGSPNCFTAILAERSPYEFWTIGMTFLQNVYSVFDYSTVQVGFAKLA